MKRMHTPYLTAAALIVTIAAAIPYGQIMADQEKNSGQQPKISPKIAKPTQAQPVAAAVDKPAPAPKLAELIAEAKRSYKPVAPAIVEGRLAELQQAIADLDKPLKNSGQDGVAWREYLTWPTLIAQTRSVDKADLTVLRELLHKFTAFEDGLEWHRFVDVADGLRNYIFLLDAARDPKTEANYQAALKTIEATVNSKSTVDLRRLNEAAAELDRDGLALDLVAALREQYSHPNLLVDVSGQFVSTGIARPVDETTPLRDNILGTQITGTGHTVGQVTGELVPDPNRIVIQTSMTGTNHSRTVGRNGPAVIYSRGVSKLSARKRLVFDSTGLHGQPTEAKVQTSTQVTGIGSTKHGVADKLVKKIAAKQIPKKKAQGEQVASQHARRLFERRFNDQAEPLIANANDRYRNKLRTPLVRMGAFPEHLRFSTTSDQLYVESKQTPERLFAASTPAPAVAPLTDVSFRLHESMINNSAMAMLAGRTLDKPQMDKMSLDLTGSLPEMGDEDAQKHWSITFASADPITFFVDDNLATVTIRGARYTSDNKPFEAMNISAKYRLAREGGRIQAMREGELEIYPPNFKPNSGEKLSTRQVVLRRMLQKRFSKIFRDSIISDGLELKGNFESLSPLPANQLVADDGWLVIGWQQPAPTKKSLAMNESE